jgi:glycosyltransferase involved in cell wall biosynthesis
MRVAVDARDLNRAHLRGMGRCLWELVARGVSHGVRWELLTDRSDLPLHLPDVPGLGVHVFECRGYRFHAWEQWALPRKVAKLGVDLLHGTSMRLPWWQPLPTVVTLHDTIPWRGNEPTWSRGWYTDCLVPRALRKCAAIITVSAASRRDILALWPDLEGKLTVIPNGVGDAYLGDRAESLSLALEAIGVRRPYLLYWGGTIPRKRLDWAVKVLEGLADPEVRLVLCGVEREAHERVRESLPAGVRQQVCFAPFIAEADMPRLYQNAVAVLYPSLYEGFGLPALEAQACGTPVLFSALGSLAELQGPGAVVLPPEDLGAWVNACRTLLAGRRESPVPDERARTWARSFSWDACVERTLAVYRQVLARVGKRGAEVGRPAEAIAKGGRV